MTDNGIGCDPFENGYDPKNEVRIHRARIAALEAEVAEAEKWRKINGDRALWLDEQWKAASRIGNEDRMKLKTAEAALATARADALEEAARVADELADKIGGLESYGAHVAAISIRALALTQPASTQPLTDQGETSTAGEVE
jgi:hypothetical protein